MSDTKLSEAVGIVGSMPGTEGFTMACFKADEVPVGTPLYLHPHSAELAEQQGDAVDELIESWTRQAKERFEKNAFSVVAESLIICARELKSAIAATGKQVGE